MVLNSRIFATCSNCYNYSNNDEEIDDEDIFFLHTVIEHANLEALKALAAQPNFDIDCHEGNSYNFRYPSPLSYGIAGYMHHTKDPQPLTKIFKYILETFPKVCAYLQYNYVTPFEIAISLESKEIIEFFFQNG